MRILSFFDDHVPSLYLVPSTLDLLRRCPVFVGSSSVTDSLRRCEELPVPFVAFAELVRGGTGLGGWKGAEFMIVDGVMEGSSGRKTWGAMDIRYI